jgi:TolA-binding protein
MKDAKRILLTLVLVSVLLSSCASKRLVLYREDGSPLSITDYEKIAQVERDNRRYENAIEAYTAIITNYSDNQNALAWSHFEVGFCYFTLKKYSEAEQYFRIVINEFQEPAAKKLAQDMLVKIGEINKK